MYKNIFKIDKSHKSYSRNSSGRFFWITVYNSLNGPSGICGFKCQNHFAVVHNITL